MSCQVGQRYLRGERGVFCEEMPKKAFHKMQIRTLQGSIAGRPCGMLISLCPARQSERAEGLDGMEIFSKRKWSLLRQHRHPVCRHTSGIGITPAHPAKHLIPLSKAEEEIENYLQTNLLILINYSFQT